MKIEHLNVDSPIDCIFETNKHIVCCGYSYSDKNRSGLLYFLNKDTLSIVESVQTSGTLHAFFKDNKIFVANSEDVSIFEETDLLCKVKTDRLNTYIQIEDYIYVSDDAGIITVYDFDLKIIKTISIVKDPVWIFKIIKNCIYLGSEAGECFKYDIQNKSCERVGNKRLGIIDIFENNDELIISSYDDNVEIFDLNTLNLKNRVMKTGSLWKILKYNNLFVCSTIYDGVKIFNSTFDLIEHIKVQTICYGICLFSDKIIWADFYKNKINWMLIDDILN